MIKEFENFLRYNKGLSENSINNYLIDIKQFIEWFKGDFSKINRFDLYDYISYLHDNFEYSISSYLRKLSSLKLFFYYLKLKENPFDNFELPKKREESQKFYPFMIF